MDSNLPSDFEVGVVLSLKSEFTLKLRLIFGELPLAIVVVVDFAIKMVWLTSLISLCLMTITNACYLVIFDTINNIPDAKIVTALKTISTVVSLVTLMSRQVLLVRYQPKLTKKKIFDSVYCSEAVLLNVQDLCLEADYELELKSSPFVNSFAALISLKTFSAPARPPIPTGAWKPYQIPGWCSAAAS